MSKLKRALTLAIRKDEKPVFTKLGYLIATVYATRSGVFDYYKADGSLYREYRPENEVFKPESMKSLEFKALTRLHPKEMLNSSNTSKYQKGIVLNEVVREGNFLKALVLVTDSDLIAEITSGKLNQLSCGYTCEVIDGDGITPDGEKYNGIQTNIDYNHLASVSLGRAGDQVRFKLDNKGDQIYNEETEATEETGDTVKNIINEQKGDQMKVTLNGKVYNLDNAEEKAAYDLEVKRIEDQNKDLSSKVDKLTAEIDFLKLDAANAPEKQAKRLGFINEVKTFLKPDEKKDDIELIKKSDLELKKLALTNITPALKLDGQTEGYINTAYDIMKANYKPAETTPPAAAKNDELEKLKDKLGGEGGDTTKEIKVDSITKYRTVYISNLSEAYKK